MSRVSFNFIFMDQEVHVIYTSTQAVFSESHVPFKSLYVVLYKPVEKGVLEKSVRMTSIGSELFQVIVSEKIVKKSGFFGSDDTGIREAWSHRKLN